MERTENRICWYSSLLIAILMNSVKLLALRENGIFAHFWHFSLAEIGFQAIYNLLFCYFVFYINLKYGQTPSRYLENEKYIPFYILNGLLLIVGIVSGSLLQYSIFGNHHLQGMYWSSYITRFSLSMFLIGIIIKIIHLLREGRKKDMENERLKGAYLTAELELLKEQMNPHFLFNSLSSLSGLIREDPKIAQVYVREISNVFRYAMTRPNVNMVTVEEEIPMLRSFARVIGMRLEGAFQLIIKVEDAILQYQLPHLSLQPLLENTVKHNAATLEKPLCVRIYSEGHDLLVCNNLWSIPVPESSNGLGLANLNERFKIMMNREIEIKKDENYFLVKLPLKS